MAIPRSATRHKAFGKNDHCPCCRPKSLSSPVWRGNSAGCWRTIKLDIHAFNAVYIYILNSKIQLSCFIIDSVFCMVSRNLGLTLPAMKQRLLGPGSLGCGFRRQSASMSFGSSNIPWTHYFDHRQYPKNTYHIPVRKWGSNIVTCLETNCNKPLEARPCNRLPQAL